MKKFLLSGVALIGLATVSSAFAADLPTRRPPPAPVVAPMFSWTGFYVGVNAGYGWNTGDDARYTYPSGYSLDLSNDSDGGFVGGAQIGYNYQMGSFVVGLETDIQYADMTGKYDWDYTYTNWTYGGHELGGDLNYFGTIRARAGFAIDKALIYATGGFAYGGGDSDKGCEWMLATGSYGRCKKSSGIGWTVGAGVEYAFTNNLTAKIEGLYVSIDRKGSNVYDVMYYGDNYRSAKSDEFGVIRAGLNYKFNTF